ncbi:hypothetical protein SARC_09623 [Sphaeroforma arctica JP610]|uniref:Uncharacterized protein n=1 Tax=Sphaeroforma arctica JP610 TaxID=667725 RepID=A0A0L0FPM9_9EUKA|nr:hypothetical protein SARC_09623 [Sphaeroforma arctica JP610]KNC77928.1 hypothetical protein SARC_09623 [Sphaeroforma arctica JP610]|eukprot:XP_014151830.1 hypothetical protein SARC_09623 [Sphaeroforma arctica JP610]
MDGRGLVISGRTSGKNIMLALWANGINGYGYHTTAAQCTERKDLTNKTYAITGVNSGLGYETGRVLALRNANIIGLARTKEKAEIALCDWQGTGEKIAIACDLSDIKSVQKAVDDVRDTGKPIDAIIANAGSPARNLYCHAY